VTVVLRNFSLTYPSKYTLKLVLEEKEDDFSGTRCAFPHRFVCLGNCGLNDVVSLSCRDLAPPSWIGRLTFRGTLEPMQHVSLTPTLLVTRPDTYALDGWQLEVEVGEMIDQSWRTLYRYLEKPSKAHRPCVTVVAIAPPS
jgi:trafficking protein particle complex subunit 8